MDEGYIKFSLEWKEKSIETPEHWEELNDIRSRLYELKLIGMYADGVGFGNVSLRMDQADSDQAFVISGTQTGNKEMLAKSDYALVTHFDIDENRVSCKGEVKASSESLTHAAIYAVDPTVNCVLHIHSKKLWDQHLYYYPTTDKHVAYGTPEMARAIQDEVINASYVPIIMGGHEEGILCYGRSGKEAFSKVQNLLIKR